MNTQIDTGTFTRFNNFFFDLTLGLGHHFLNSSWVNTSIGNELMQCQSGNFPADGIETAQDDRFRGVIHNDFNSCCSFNCPNVTAFTTYNSSLHFIVFDVEDRYRILHSMLGGNALDGLNHNTLGFFICRKPRFFHDVLDVRSGFCFRFFFQCFHQLIPRLLCRKSCNDFQLFHLTSMLFVKFSLLFSGHFQLLVECITLSIDLRLLAFGLFQFLT